MFSKSILKEQKRRKMENLATCIIHKLLMNILVACNHPTFVFSIRVNYFSFWVLNNFSLKAQRAAFLSSSRTRNEML